MRSLLLSVFFFFAPISSVYALGILESLLLSHIIQWGTLSLQQELDAGTTVKINQNLQQRLPLPIGNAFTMNSSSALGAGILEWQISSNSIDAKTFEDPKVAQALDQSMVPFLKMNICNPSGFWHQQWLPRKGTVIVRLNSSDGKLVRTYTAQKKDCP